MDILTEKGQETLRHEQRAMELWLSKFPQHSYIQTPKDKPAIIDAIISVDNVVTAVVETKCRDYTLQEFQKKFKSEWMVTHEKLIKSSHIASGLCVPFIGLLYLVPDDILLRRTLWKPDVGFVCTMYIRTIWTQASVNGGKALRSNAFIDMRDAKQIIGDRHG